MSCNSLQCPQRLSWVSVELELQSKVHPDTHLTPLEMVLFGMIFQLLFQDISHHFSSILQDPSISIIIFPHLLQKEPSFCTQNLCFHILFVYSLSQWLDFKLSGITCLVGKISRLNFYLRVHWLSEYRWWYFLMWFIAEWCKDPNGAYRADLAKSHNVWFQTRKSDDSMMLGCTGAPKWKIIKALKLRHLHVFIFINIISRWWFQIFLIFTPTWGNDPIWPIFFKGVETTN